MKKIFSYLCSVLFVSCILAQEIPEAEGEINTTYIHTDKDILSFPIYPGCENISEGENTKLHNCMTKKLTEFIYTKVTSVEMDELWNSGASELMNLITVYINKEGNIRLLKSYPSKDKLYEKLLQPRIKEAFEEHPKLIAAKTKDGRFVDFQHNIRLKMTLAYY